MTKPPRYLSLLRHHGGALLPLLALIVSCHGFASQIPRIRLPWDDTTTTPSAKNNKSSNMNITSRKSPIQPNDKIVVFGGTGGVGQLVTRKLLARRGGNNKAYTVGVVARDASRARKLLLGDNGDDENDDDISYNNNSSRLEVSELDLVGATQATDDQLRSVMAGSSGIVVSLGTTAFPTQRWKGGNTPQAIDCDAVSRIARLAAEIPTLRRMV